MVWDNLWPICGHYMALIWVVASHTKPINSVCFDLAPYFIVFPYGIATYFVKFHIFPIGSGMEMIWDSPIPIPYDD